MLLQSAMGQYDVVLEHVDGSPHASNSSSGSAQKAAAAEAAKKAFDAHEESLMDAILEEDL